MVPVTGLQRDHAVPLTDLGNLQRLPHELIMKCLRHLSPWNLAAASLVNRQLYGLCNDPFLWRGLCKEYFPHQPVELAPKLHYQVCSNIRKGRYAVQDNFAPPGALLFQENQKVQRFPNTTQAIVLPNQDGSFQSVPLPPDADLNNLYLEWNGNQLAVACYTFPTQSIQIFNIQQGQLQLRQTIPMRSIGFLWHGQQLITASISQGHVVIQIWNPDQTGNLQVQCICNPPGSDWVIETMDFRDQDEEYEVYHSFAWDGKWLAINNRAGNGNVNVWKETQGQLRQEAIVSVVSRHSLRWKGNLLFMEDEDDKFLIWDRDTKAFCQKKECFGLNVQLSEVFEDITDVHIRGNQLFLAFGRTISLWETNKHGIYQMVYNCFHRFPCRSLNFHHGALFVRSESLRDRVQMISFTASHQKMLETLRDELKQFASEELYPDLSKRERKGFHLMWQRLVRMPKSKTQPIFQELDQILMKAGKGYPGCAEAHINRFTPLPFTPLQLSLAVYFGISLH